MSDAARLKPHLTQPPHLLCFGLGYTARVLAGRLAADGWTVTGTARAGGDGLLRFERGCSLGAAAFAGVTHILVSIPPDETGDPVFDRHGDDIAALPGLDWFGYLSTTGVYGDCGGDWVDETSELRPSGERGRRTVPAAARSPRCAPAARRASPSRDRCFPASMSKIWRACWRPRSPGRAPARSIMCATTSRRRPRRWLPMPPGCSGCRRRRWCRSRMRSCRRWRAASTPTTSGSQTR